MIDSFDVNASVTTQTALERALREAFGTSAGVAISQIDGELPVMAEESCYIARAHAKRRAEFSHGRHCARRALAELGIVVGAIPRNPFGAPCWPPGISGSIAHEHPWALAIVRPSRFQETIGIDLLDQRHEIDPELFARVVSRDDRWCEQAGMETEQQRQIVFSAKESVVKAISPQLERFVELHDISVWCTPTAFSAAYPGLTGSLVGNIYLVDNLILTTVTFTPVHA